MRKKIIKRVNPLGMRVVVQILPDIDRTESGLYLPEGAKGKLQESLLAEVIEVATTPDDKTNISGIPKGSFVLIPKEKGVKVDWDDSLRIIESSEILAIVEIEEII